MKQVVYFRVSVLLFALYVAALPQVNGQNNIPGRIIDPLQNHPSVQNPQKLFIHFDKNHYEAAETIWFKGYVMNGTDLLPDTSTANVYVELWDVQENKILDLILSPVEGVFSGQIDLGKELPDGNYLIRAFTDLMLNHGKQALFCRYFYISNPEFAQFIDNDTRRFNRDFNRELEAMQKKRLLSFHPEGGQLIAGLESRVAIRVTDATGRGLVANGVIKDSNGKQHISFQTNTVGIGEFVLTPAAGAQYHAEITLGQNILVKAELPLPASEGISLKAELKQTALELVLTPSQGIAVGKEYSLVAHTRGDVVFLEQNLIIEQQKTIRIPLIEIPTGVTHLTLFSDLGRPLAERLVFVNQDDQVFFDIRALMLQTQDANALNIDLLASNTKGLPLQGKFSVSVQYGDVGERIFNENIFSHVFLSSELYELIEDPAWYFDYGQDEIEKMADLLMLTHTWRDFHWSHSPGQLSHAFKPQYGIQLSGRLYNAADNSGYKDLNVRMRQIENVAQSFSATTDQQGKFFFSNISLADSSFIEIIPPMVEGRKLPEIELFPKERNPVNFPAITFMPNFQTLPQQVVDRGSNWSRQRPPRAPRTAPVRGASLYGQPDQTIRLTEKDHYPKMMDVIRERVTGLLITSSGIRLGGVTSINYQSEPLFIVDGVESMVSFMELNVKDVDRIEVFKGPSTAAFGLKGAGGVLVAYTKEPQFVTPTSSQSVFIVDGLHSSREFQQQSPKTHNRNPMNTVNTAFWEPNIVTGEDGMASFQFFPVPGVTQYRIIVQGLSTDGKIGYSEFLIGN